MVTTILFDLDGTLLPMDQEQFIHAYLGKMTRKMAPHGYDPELLAKSIWKGTGAMVMNDGSISNEELFWKVFSHSMGRDTREDEALFISFYENEFQTVRDHCGFHPMTAEIIRTLKEMDYRVVLATNPLFPSIATYSRARWAGLNPDDFALITTYENSCHCKPNPEYYRDILRQLNAKPEECVMVGNDVAEDMMARELGMQVFLLKDCMINKYNQDISTYPQGGFPELMEFLRNLT